MNNRDFKVGDIVVLVGQSIQMTVIEIESGEVRCAWYNSNKEIQRMSFPFDALQNQLEVTPILG